MKRTSRETQMIGARRRLAGVCLATAFALLALYANATASPAPPLHVSSTSPDYVTPGNGVKVYLGVLNASGAPLSGDLHLTYTFPEGIEPTEPLVVSANVALSCAITGQIEECVGDVSAIGPDVLINFMTFSQLDPGASGTNMGSIEVSGGGLPQSYLEPFEVTVGPVGPFAIEAFDLALRDSPQVAAEHAGASPGEVAAKFRLASQAKSNFEAPMVSTTSAAPPESFHDTATHVPAGLIGNPLATPVRCPQALLTSPFNGTVIPQCPVESQVGWVQLVGTDIAPLYNVQPPAGAPAALGFMYQSIVTTLLARIRPSDHGIDIYTRNTPTSIPLSLIEVVLWGHPNDETHDRFRGLCLKGYTGYNGEPCPIETRSDIPFLRNPTSCTGALPWSIEMDTYQHPGTFVSKSTTSPAMEGCEELPFDPDISLEPSETGARASSGLDAELTMPQATDPDGLAEADLRETKVTLPQGVSINPSSADGLGACSDSELGLDREGPSSCPDSSKLGTLEVKTPLLEETVGGSVFLRSQGSSKDPASGDLYRLAIELRNDERGVAIKLPGSLSADPTTGQLTATFKNLPQLPFESLQLHLKSGPRAPLTLPSTCGTYKSHAELTSWSGKSASFDPAFTIDKSCAAPPFSPGFEAGVTDNAAGSYAPLLFRVTRDSGEPNIARIETTLPEGELAKFAGLTLCSPSGMAAGSCPASSRIGSAMTAIGEGTSPLFLPQAGKQPIDVYVGGPYQGAPYSVLVSVPAQAGPFDLGTVLVRSQVKVDPETTRASVISDPLPQIHAGIPVTYRDIRVNVDRPEYAINPTDCEPKSFDGAISSSQGQEAEVSDRFQVTDCARLGFKPKLTLKLKGEVSRGSHPRLITNLKARAGDANIARAQVKLPPSAFLDQSHIGTICTRVQFAQDACPKRSVYGRAWAKSPLLDYPLKGNVYLRSSSHKLPDLVVDLNGPYTTPLEVALAGKTDSVKGALRSTFEAVPDAPVSKFHLELFGAKKGLIEMSGGFCANPTAQLRFTAQNGKELEASPEVEASECGAKRSGRRG